MSPQRRKRLERTEPQGRIDERDIMFSRWRLEPGTERFSQYYSAHPEREAIDQAIRDAPGLLKPGSAYYHALMFSAADATFDTVDQLHALVDGPVHDRSADISAGQLTEFLRGWLLQLGAHSVGVTTLREEHCYSHVGRGGDYGSPITPRHRFALALTVEMDHAMVQHAPAGPISMESSREYLRSGEMAVQVAQMLRRLGWPARAHIDGRYEVVCPLVARDAGLGDIGRMGLLMTPRLGPRVRIAVVTTDAPLLIDEPSHDEAMLDFCMRCKKCADTCPAKAIPDGLRIDADGNARWQIDSEACFGFWNEAGTDCGRCMAVCPYSHADNILHNTVRWCIARSSLLRRAAVPLDDLLYGRKPAPKPLQRWMAPPPPST